MSSVVREADRPCEEMSRPLGSLGEGAYCSREGRILLVVGQTKEAVRVFDGQAEFLAPLYEPVLPAPAPRVPLELAWLALHARRHHFFWQSEKELQRGLADVWAKIGAKATREAALGSLGQVDFLVTPGIAVEVKLKAPASQVIRQLWRYAESDLVQALLLVTTSLALSVEVPDVIRGKSLLSVVVGHPLA